MFCTPGTVVAWALMAEPLKKEATMNRQPLACYASERDCLIGQKGAVALRSLIGIDEYLKIECVKEDAQTKD
jgi:hypothetical protein